MAHLNIYIEDNLLKYIQTSAKIEKVSMSKWIRNKITMDFDKSKWPENYFDIFGSLANENFECPERIKMSVDTSREKL